MSNPSVIDITDATFDKAVLESSRPVLLDFWADWCGPCKMIAPLINEAAVEYQDKLTVAKLNIDDNPNTPKRFHVRRIPTLILFKDGAVQAQREGTLRKSDLAALLDGKL